MGLVQTVLPVAEPLSVAEVKPHLRNTSVDLALEDTLIGSYISAAREYVEAFTERQLMTATWRLSLDWFPCGAIRPPRPPLQTVVSIEYVEINGTTQTLDSSKYRVDSDSEPGRITEAVNESWPVTQSVTNAVKVTFVAGYADAAQVPEKVKQAMRMLTAAYYENREPTALELNAVNNLLWMAWPGSYR